jgi:hypothetical protein
LPDINSRERLVLSINSDYYGTSISNRVLMKDMKGGRWKWNQVEMEIAVESAVMSYLFPPFCHSLPALFRHLLCHASCSFMLSPALHY